MYIATIIDEDGRVFAHTGCPDWESLQEIISITHMARMVKDNPHLKLVVRFVEGEQ